MPEKSIGTGAAAEILGCSRDYVSKLCREGYFETATQDKVGSPWHISEQEVIKKSKGKTRK